MRTMPEPFTLRVDGDLLGDPQQWSFALLRPLPYDPTEHRTAAQDEDFSRLTETLDLQASIEDGVIVLEVPVLEPWGILLVKPNDRI